MQVIKRIRALFKKVYCEDCANCVLDMDFDNKEKQLEFAQCEAKMPKPKMVSRDCPLKYYCCSVVRLLPFCFKFKPKAGK